MDTSQQDKPIPVVSKKPPADKESWDSFITEQQQKTPSRIEDAAKFVATMISLSLSLFLAIGGGLLGFSSHENLLVIKIAFIVMIIALAIAFLVMYPYSYKYISNSSADIKRMHKKIVQIKYMLLTISFILFVSGLIILGFVLL